MKKFRITIKCWGIKKEDVTEICCDLETINKVKNNLENDKNCTEYFKIEEI